MVGDHTLLHLRILLLLRLYCPFHLAGCRGQIKGGYDDRKEMGGEAEVNQGWQDQDVQVSIS